MRLRKYDIGFHGESSKTQTEIDILRERRSNIKVDGTSTSQAYSTKHCASEIKSKNWVKRNEVLLQSTRSKGVTRRD